MTTEDHQPRSSFKRDGESLPRSNGLEAVYGPRDVPRVVVGGAGHPSSLLSVTATTTQLSWLESFPGELATPTLMWSLFLQEVTWTEDIFFLTEQAESSPGPRAICGGRMWQKGHGPSAGSGGGRASRWGVEELPFQLTTSKSRLSF